MGKKALMVHGGWNGHTPFESVQVFAPILQKEGYDVELSDTLDSYLNPDLTDYDLIVPCWTMGNITSEQEAGLLAAIKSGVGLGGWHGGIIDSFRQKERYQLMTGAQWVAHPGGADMTYRVDIIDQNHPITEGIESFVLPKTEQYYCHVDPSISREDSLYRMLCETTFSGEHAEGIVRPGTVMPYAWIKPYGDGKVFVASWGHTYKDFDVPEAKEIIRRGLLYASR